MPFLGLMFLKFSGATAPKRGCRPCIPKKESFIYLKCIECLLCASQHGSSENTQALGLHVSPM